jgi:succinylarginine dihydrolase
VTDAGPLHLFAWGRSGFEPEREPSLFPRRQTREASLAVSRLNALSPSQVMTWQQHGHGIDAGAFHTDVLAASNDGFLMLHEHAFVHHRDLVLELKRRLGDGFRCVVAHETDLPAKEAVSSYPFNSQIVTLPGGEMAIVAPVEASESEAARRFLDRVVAEDNAVSAVHYVDVNASMSNGGGPACLRLRCMLTRDEEAALGGRVVLDDTLYADLVSWVERRYRDRMREEDLADPALLTEVREALDELTRILVLGSVYDFQRTPP